MMKDDSPVSAVTAQHASIVRAQDDPLCARDSRESNAASGHDGPDIPEDFIWPPTEEFLPVFSSDNDAAVLHGNETVPVRPTPAFDRSSRDIDRSVDLRACIAGEFADGQTHAAGRAVCPSSWEEADIRLERERIVLEKRIEIQRAEGAVEREAERAQYAALSQLLEDARVQIETIRTEAHAQLEPARTRYAQVLQEVHSHIEQARAELQRVRAEAVGAIEAVRAESERTRTAQEAQLDHLGAQLAQVQHEASRSRAETANAIEASRVEAGRACNVALEARADLQRVRAEAAGAIEAVRAESERTRTAQEAQLDHLGAQLAQVQQEASRSRAETANAIETSRVEADRACNIALEARADLQRVRTEAARAIEAVRAESERTRTAQEQLDHLGAQLAQMRREAQLLHAEPAHIIEPSRVGADRARHTTLGGVRFRAHRIHASEKAHVGAVLRALVSTYGQVLERFEATRPWFGWGRSRTLAVVILAALLIPAVTARRLVGGLRAAHGVDVANLTVIADTGSPTAGTGHDGRSPVWEPAVSVSAPAAGGHGTAQHVTPVPSTSARTMSHSAQRVEGASSTAVLRHVYSEEDVGVSRPVPIRQELPPWVGADHSLQATTLIDDPRLRLPSKSRGVLEVLIDEKGSVASATMQESIGPSVDQRVIDATKTWRYRPANMNGRPVGFKKSLQVLLR